MPIQETEIDRAYRLGVSFTDKKGKKQQSVLVKFNSWKARNVMFKARRHSSFYMKADMTKRRFGVLKYAQSEIANNIEASKLINYIYVDTNCNIVAFTSTGSFLKFNTETEFDLTVLDIQNNLRASEDIYAAIARDWATMHPRE